MRYVPIYLHQGLVVLSLTSGTFLLMCSPLLGSSWRIGRGRACNLTPHFLCMSSFGSCGHRLWQWGFQCTPEWTSVVSLLDHEPLLLPVEEFKEYIVDPDAELDFSRSDIDPSLHTIQEWSSEDKVQSQVSIHVENDKIGQDEAISDSYVDVFDYPFGMSDCGVCKLYKHTGLGKSRIL